MEVSIYVEKFLEIWAVAQAAAEGKDVYNQIKHNKPKHPLVNSLLFEKSPRITAVHNNKCYVLNPQIISRWIDYIGRGDETIFYTPPEWIGLAGSGIIESLPSVQPDMKLLHTFKSARRVRNFVSRELPLYDGEAEPQEVNLEEFNNAVFERDWDTASRMAKIEADRRFI